MLESETFFTVVGCMDGRVQEPNMRFGQEKFDAQFPDTITGPGIVHSIARSPSSDFLKDLRGKIDISVEKHGSKGVIVNGHAECAGNQVSKEQHVDDIRESVKVIRDMVPGSIYVVGVWLERDSENKWVAEEVRGSAVVG